MKDFGHSGHWCRFFLGEGAGTDEGEEGDDGEPVMTILLPNED